MADKEERGNRPEAQRGPQKVAVYFLGQEQRCVEGRFPIDDAVCRNFSLLQPEAILRQVLVMRESMARSPRLFFVL